MADKRDFIELVMEVQRTFIHKFMMDVRTLL